MFLKIYQLTRFCLFFLLYLTLFCLICGGAFKPNSFLVSELLVLERETMAACSLSLRPSMLFRAQAPEDTS